VQLSDGRGIPVVLEGDILGQHIVSRGFRPPPRVPFQSNGRSLLQVDSPPDITASFVWPTLWPGIPLVFLGNGITLSTPSMVWVNTAPNSCLLASVCRENLWAKSGYARPGASVSHDSYSPHPHPNSTVDFSVDMGSTKFSTNRLFLFICFFVYSMTRRRGNDVVPVDLRAAGALGFLRYCPV